MEENTMFPYVWGLIRFVTSENDWWSLLSPIDCGKIVSL
jgi:hypothetical protein